MLPDDLRKKVEAIGRRRPRRPPLPPVTGEERTGVPLEKALGARVLERPEGACLLVQRRIEEVLPDADEVEALYRHVLERGACDPDRAARHPHLAALLEREPAELVYLDLEAGGLDSSASVFLAGLMTYADGALTVSQLLARHPSEEGAVVAAAGDILAKRPVLVTFNGRAFDWPCLTARAEFFGVSLAPPALHVDLLHLARGLWKRDLPDCRLTTLEALVCRRHRSGDVPSRRVPAVYRDFLESGDPARLRILLRHNVMDVVSMAELLLAMLLGRDAFGD